MVVVNRIVQLPQGQIHCDRFTWSSLLLCVHHEYNGPKKKLKKRKREKMKKPFVCLMNACVSNLKGGVVDAFRNAVVLVE